MGSQRGPQLRMSEVFDTHHRNKTKDMSIKGTDIYLGKQRHSREKAGHHKGKRHFGGSGDLLKET